MADPKSSRGRPGRLSPEMTRRAFIGAGFAAAIGVSAGLIIAEETGGGAPAKHRSRSEVRAGAVPQPTIRWGLRNSIEGWKPTAGLPSTTVSHDPSGWLRGSGTDSVGLASYEESDRNVADWRIPGRSNADRLSLSTHIESSTSSTATLVVTMAWLGATDQLMTADSVSFEVPCGLDIDVDTWWNCRGTAPNDVLQRVIGVGVVAKAPGALTVLLRDVRQPPSLETYGAMPKGVGRIFLASAPTVPEVRAPDVFAAQVLGHLDSIASWGRINNRAIHIGEWAWPKQAAGQTAAAAPSIAAWTALADQWMTKADGYAIPYTPWGESAYWAGDRVDDVSNYGSYEDASFYCGEPNYDRPDGNLPRVVNARKPSSAVLAQHVGAVAGIASSINVVGGCFTHLKDGTQFSSTNIGQRGYDYFVENPNTIDYLYGQGFRLFRMPFRWDRVMRTYDADELDPVEWGYVKNGIEHILSLPDAGVIVDQHSSAEYWISPNPDDLSVPANQYVVDGPGSPLTTDTYVHFWQLVSDSLRQHSDRLVYEITNEPHGAGASSFTVKRYTQAVVSALRARGDSTFVLIPSFPYDNVVQAIEEQNQPFPWITDPAGSRFHAYTFHAYMDSGMSGEYLLTYQQEVAKAAAAG